MSKAWPPATAPRFRCPICRCTSFEQLKPSAPDKSTPLYACHGCKVVFLDPVAFTAFDPNGTSEGTAGPGGAHRR